MNRIRSAIAASLVFAAIVFAPAVLADNPPNRTPHQPPIPALPCPITIYVAHPAPCTPQPK